GGGGFFRAPPQGGPARDGFARPARGDEGGSAHGARRRGAARGHGRPAWRAARAGGAGAGFGARRDRAAGPGRAGQAWTLSGALTPHPYLSHVINMLQALRYGPDAPGDSSVNKW